MSTFDRYLLRLFVKVLLACFVSMVGLYIVIDAFGNLDEFLGYGRVQGSVLAVIADYYSARIPWFFDHASGLLALVAGMFAITWLQKTNELTALMAAGVTTKRIIRPLVAAAIVVSIIAAANREFVIPEVRDKLVRNAQDWLGDTARPVDAVTDNRTDILIGGRASFAADQRIQEPTFTLHRPIGEFGRKLIAEDAFYHEPTAERPGGYLLEGVSYPDEHAEFPSASLDGEPVILSSSDNEWLSEDQLFVVSDVTFSDLACGPQYRTFASTGELVTGLSNPSLDFGLGTRVSMHARFVQPFLDVTLFVLGLPLVLSRQNRSVFVAAGLGIGIVIAYFLVTIVCQALGASGLLMSPALAAWAPLMILAPTAAALSQPIWE
ncbi:MAG TPA: LptF/LptG family permease [Pirellulaceae bacterium]|nr:LptF/LptG family permease [Planctomycetales bacterium]MCB9938056.1 LptF/LptG family permease [Planctomycetaceae bacterium]HRX82018.1 LptF/LptG family permease [Pirellulaceae bacterium]